MEETNHRDQGRKQETMYKKNSLSLPLSFFLSACLFFSGCGIPFANRKEVPQGNGAGLAKNAENTTEKKGRPSASGNAAVLSDLPDPEGWESRQLCLQPSAGGSLVYENQFAVIDVSNSEEGYFMAAYKGDVPKVKLQLTGPRQVTYTYTLYSGFEAFPLNEGNGSYTAVIYENVSDDAYTAVLSQSFNVSIRNEYGPFLYPNQRVDFGPSSTCVQKAAVLAGGAADELEVLERIYNYVVEHVAYDHAKAAEMPVTGGYISRPDETLRQGQGICLDYAVLMTSMLRSLGIPTRLEVGYVGSLYHAWISVHIEESGWVNDAIVFNGQEWKLMDPTFAANSTDRELEAQIGSGSRYITKYFY